MVELLSLAHGRTCEAQLGQLLQQYLTERRLPDLNELSDYEALVHRHTEVQA